LNCIAEGRRQKEEGRRKKEEAIKGIKARVLAIKNVLTVGRGCYCQLTTANYQLSTDN
jgi:hypothetical protein